MKKRWLRYAWLLPLALLLSCAFTLAALADEGYALTVTGGRAEGGAGDNGKYPAGAAVTLHADDAPAGKVFYRWTVTAGLLDDAYSADARLTMPAAGVAATAGYTEKTRLIITGVSVTPLKTYDGQPVLPAGTPVAKRGPEPEAEAVTLLPADYVYTYMSADGSYVSAEPPKNAGSYRLIVTIADGNTEYFGTSGDIPFVISPAALTVAPTAGQTRYIGLPNPAFAYEASGAVDGETPAFTGALAGAAEPLSAAGDYAITLGTLAPADNGTFLAGNYAPAVSADAFYTVAPFTTDAAATAADTNRGPNGAYTGEITLLAPDGYTISLSQLTEDYAPSATVPPFSGTRAQYYYLRETASGAVTGAKSIELSCAGPLLGSPPAGGAISGTATIDGEAKYNETLTASLSGAEGLTLTYAWRRDDGTETVEDTILQTGASNAYVPVAADVGQALYVEISAEGLSGSVKSENTAVIARADAPSPPDAPRASARSMSSITLASGDGLEYRCGDGEWKGSAVFEHLEANTSYTFYCRYAQTAVREASEPSAGAQIATYGELAGTVSVSGKLAFGVPLTASLSGGNGDQLSWRWLRDQTVVSTVAGYTPVREDIGKTLVIEVTSAAQSGTVRHTTAAIAKADYAGSLPGAPTVAAFTATEVRLGVTDGYEYSCGGEKWQTNATFTGLEPGKSYSFYQRVRETDTHLCSAAGPALPLTTVPALTGTVYVSGDARFGKTVVASFGQTNNSGTLSYTWKRGNMVVGTGETYNVQALDIGNQLSVEVKSSVQHGSVIRILGTVQKAEYVGNTPDAPTRDGRSSSSVTLTPVPGCEYSMDGVKWQSNTRFSGLTAEKTYKFYQRVKATSTVEASPASKAASIATSEASAGSDDDDNNDEIDNTGAVTALYSLTLTGDNTRVLSTSMSSLIKGNQTQDVTLKLDNASFTFLRGTMQAIDGKLWYDFGVKVNGCIHEQAAATAAGEGYVSTVHYDYDGKLPASANIKLWLGAKHAGKTLYYYKFDANARSFTYMQTAVVDTTGWVAVAQDSCSDYVFCDRDILGAAPTPTPDAAAATPSPSPDASPTVAPVSAPARTQSMSGWVLALVICAALLLIVGGIWMYVKNRD